MGYYINPKNKSKEQWLIENGSAIDVGEIRLLASQPGTFTTLLPVCLVDNGWMTAAGIAYDAGELLHFLSPDNRPKTWYLVPREKLKEWCDAL